MAPQSPRNRPPFDARDAQRLATSVWGVVGRADELPGDIDRNFRFEAADGTLSLLKFSRDGGGSVPLAVQQDAIARVAGHPDSMLLSRALPTPAGSPVHELQGPDGHSYAAVRATWIEGAPLARFRPRSAGLVYRIGRGLGAVAETLATFDHPSLHRTFDWELRRGPDIVDRIMPRIEDASRRKLLESIARQIRDVRSRLDALPVQVVHGDANDYNIIVGLEGSTPVPGLIDFGDMAVSWRVADLAIGAAYIAMDQRDPVATISGLASGFCATLPLDDEELDLLPALVALRLAVSACQSAMRSATEPDDPYLIVSERPAWDLMEKLASIHGRLAAARIRVACGREPSPRGRRVVQWLTSDDSRPRPVFHAESSSAGATVLDLSVAGSDVDGIADPADVERWDTHLSDIVGSRGASIGVGRYLEPRLCYTQEQFQVEGTAERQRTVHLGVDLFAPAGTRVHAPFDAVVESVVDNDKPLDYGPTVILHHGEQGLQPSFRTLYGHLAPGVLASLRSGDSVAGGEPFAELGTAAENGGWPPHLHFQVLADTLDRKDGDFPGVALPSEADAWAGLCPDPNLILGLDAPVRYERGDSEALEARRKAVLGPSLSLSYAEPLHIVRGSGPYLYDADGRQYLDGVNNVCHVGHCHPRVVAAIRSQAGMLNTNTRYLHEHLLDYAEQLVETFPEPLEVCFLVNSGSEANDLALRMARLVTGRMGVICVEGGYHGNLGSLVDISHYKYDGPGSPGEPEHVRAVRLPDPYRGALRTPEPDLGVRYASDVVGAAWDLDRAGFGTAAFVAEAILSCGGQIVPPDGYLVAAAGHARDAGGLYIADEVQTGFGRVGTHMWAFEASGVVPDIVTLGKPIGNGHPIGAVVTTREIAGAFANGMEYFNTYGGNPVSCAAGLAVLGVIKGESLMQNAAEMGERLMRGLRDLQESFPIIGDVRGRGLFAGFELVADREARTPDAAAATWLANRARELGVLVSTDGPDHNVIKLKPPMVLGAVEVDRLLQTLREALSDDYLRPATVRRLPDGPNA